MKKSVLIFIILLLVSMLSMIGVSPVDANSTKIYVNPPSVIDDTLQPEPAKTIRPNGDGTFKDWTHKTLTIRPNGDGTYMDWPGRILTLNPNDHGTYTEWSSWAHIIPDGNGIYTGWIGMYSSWDDWPTHDEDTYVSATADDKNETSTFANPPSEPRALTINKVRLTMVAKNTQTSDEKVQMMLLGPLNRSVTGRVVDESWDGWTKVGSSPWLGAADYPSNYVYTSVTNDKIGNFTFGDVPTGLAWGGVTLSIRTWKSGVNPDDRMNIYMYDGAGWEKYESISIPSEMAPGTYVEIDVSSFLNTEAKINAARMCIEKITLGAVEDTIHVDHAYLFCRALDYGLETVLPLTFTEYTSEWSTNPATGSAWTWQEIDWVEAGVQSRLGDDMVWTGEIRVTQLYVSVLTGGLYTDLDEWPDHNGDTDYVAATAKDKPQSSALQNHTTEDWPIAKVQVGIVARTTGDETKLTLMLVIGGTVYEGVTIDPLSTTYSEYTSEWSTNPAGGAWTWEAIDALEAGVKTRVAGPAWKGGEIRVTQLYVKVIEPGTYAHWDETTQDEDATYVSAISDAQYQSSTLQNPAPQTWSIARVQVSIVAKTFPSYDVPTNEKVTIILVVGGTAYEGSTYGLTTTYSTYSSVWTENPRYNIPWNWTAIDALEAGVKSLQVNGWKGEIRVTQLYVVVGEPGTYTEWDEEVQNEDTDYVSATMDGMKESSALENPTYPTWNIARVRVVFYAKAIETTDEKVQPTLVIGGTRYLGKAYTPNTTYVKYTADWGKNPSTGSYWTWPEIDSLEAGVQSRLGDDMVWTGEIRVTQLYVEVAGPRAFTVDIQVENVPEPGVFGYEFILNYTTTTLTATSVTIGDFLLPGYFEWRNVIDDDLGYVSYSASQGTGEYTGVTGNGTLATITFLVDCKGVSPLDLYDTKLRDNKGNPISHLPPYDGYFRNTFLSDIRGPEDPPGSGLYPPDGTVDGWDYAFIGLAFGKTSADPAWDDYKIADTRGPEDPPGSGLYPPDGVVDGWDYAYCGLEFGSTLPDP